MTDKYTAFVVYLLKLILRLLPSKMTTLFLSWLSQIWFWYIPPWKSCAFLIFVYLFVCFLNPWSKFVVWAPSIIGISPKEDSSSKMRTILPLHNKSYFPLRISNFDMGPEFLSACLSLWKLLLFTFWKLLLRSKGCCSSSVPSST